MPFCPHCGAASVEPDQRFCQACGQALESAPAAPVPPPEPAAPAPSGTWIEPPTNAYPPAGPPAPQGEYQFMGAPFDPAAPVHGGPKLGKILAVVAVVVALAGGAFLAYTLFFNKGGGKTPEDAVTKMFEAVADQDGVQALRMLNPGETDGFDDVYKSVQKRVADAGLASDKDGKVLDAVKIELTDFKVDVEKKGDNAARVYIKDGHLKVTIDEGKLPDSYKDLYENLDQDVLDQLKDIDISSDVIGPIQDDTGVRPFLTTIKQDGRWYVSPIATVGEYLVDDADLDELTASDFDKVADENAPKPKTSKNPEDALRVLADAVSSDKVENIFAALPKDEVAALRPFTDILQDQLDNSDGADLRVSELDTSFKELGDDLGRLTIKHGKIEGTIDGEDGFATLDGTCVDSSDTNEVYNPDTGEYDTEPTTNTECIPDEVRDQAGIDSIWVILHKENGGWQVDPRATLIDYAKKAIESIDESTLKDAFNQ